MSLVPDMNKLRPNHMKLLDLIECGGIDTTKLATDLLGWMNDDDIVKFCHANDIQLEPEDDEETSEEGEDDENQ